MENDINQKGTIEEIVLKSLPTEQDANTATSTANYCDILTNNKFLFAFEQGYANKRGGVWGDNDPVTCQEEGKRKTYSLSWLGASKLADKVKEEKISTDILDPDLLSPFHRGMLYSSVVRSFQLLAGERIGGAAPQRRDNLGLSDQRTYCIEIVAGLYLLDMLETPTCTELLNHLLKKKPILSEYIHEAIERYAPMQLGLDFEPGSK